MSRDKEKRTEYMRRWRAAHPQYVEYMRRWRKQNKAHVEAYSREYYSENREAQIASVRSSQEKKWDEFLLRCRVNTANHRYPGKLTLEGLKQVIERSDGKCCWCGKENLQGEDLTLEHLRPTNSLEDLAIACNSCNARRRELGRPRLSETRLAAIREKRRQYLNRRDPELIAVKERIYRANRRYPGKLTIEHHNEIVAKSEGKCHWCKKAISGRDFTLDHIKPNNDLGSIVASCRSCNASKKVIGKRTLTEVKEHRTALRPVAEPFSPEERVLRMRASTKKWRSENPERVKELEAKYREEDRETLNERAREWKKAHRPQINAYRKTRREQETAASREYRQRNPEKVKAWKTAWREANREKINKQKREAYARKKREKRAELKAAAATAGG